MTNGHADEWGEARASPGCAVEQRDRHTATGALAQVGEEARRLGSKRAMDRDVSGIKRIRGGRTPYSVLTQWAAMEACAVRRRASVWLAFVWLRPAGSQVLMSRSV
jgi:hypothetical protein